MRYFVAVAEELSFTRAALRLHMAQPPLSRAVKNLEKQLGVSLFDRTTRRVELTSAGRLLLEEARTTIDRFDNALARAAQAGRIEDNTLRVGFRPAASLPLLEPVVREFRARYPQVRVESSRIEWSDQAACLLTGRVDTAFTLHPLHDHQIDMVPLLAAPRAVAMPTDHPLSARGSLSIDDLRTESLAIPSGAPPKWREFWTAEPRTLDEDVVAAPLVKNADESLAAVLSGQAFVLAIATVMSYYPPGSLAIVPIDDIAPAVIGLASLRDTQHPAIPLFLDVAEQMADVLADSLARDLAIAVAGPSVMAGTDLREPLPTPYPVGQRPRPEA